VSEESKSETKPERVEVGQRWRFEVPIADPVDLTVDGVERGADAALVSVRSDSGRIWLGLQEPWLLNGAAWSFLGHANPSNVGRDQQTALCGRVTWWGFGRRWYGTATGEIHDEGLGVYAIVDPDDPKDWTTRLVLLSHVHPVGAANMVMAGELEAIEQAARDDLAVRPIDLVKRACDMFERRADEALRMAQEIRYLRERERELIDRIAELRYPEGA
jgi:hypothetical protein